MAEIAGADGAHDIRVSEHLAGPELMDMGSPLQTQAQVFGVEAKGTTTCAHGSAHVGLVRFRWYRRPAIRVLAKCLSLDMCPRACGPSLLLGMMIIALGSYGLLTLIGQFLP